MGKNNLILRLCLAVAAFFILFLMQAGAMPYLAIRGQEPNLIFILFFIFIFFEKSQAYLQGFLLALIAGFFLDISLPSYFGISIVALEIIYIFEKIIFRFLKQGKNPYPFFYFASLFALAFFNYYFFVYLASLMFDFSVNFGLEIFVSLAYNLALGSLGFFLYKKIYSQELADSQLKLF